MSVLVTGGAGYIGSHCVRALRARGRDVVVLDNLGTGHRRAAGDAAFVRGDLLDTKLVRRTLKGHRIEAVVHFAACSLVGESMENPVKYYENNVCGTLSLLKAMREEGVGLMVFSSSAATYGQQERMPITEAAPQVPTSVYGTTKLLMERMLSDMDAAHGMRSVALRYFNVAGADPSAEIGEDHRPETHLIPIILQVLLGQREQLRLFGTDYPTADGTCVRDYIHVTDLIDAHLLALEHLEAGGVSKAYNLGNGAGFSNREIIAAVERVTGKTVPVVEAERRPGDPPTLIASSERIMTELGWRPRLDSLEAMVGTAWRWHQSHPRGYR